MSRVLTCVALWLTVVGCGGKAKPTAPGAPLNVFADAGYAQAGVAWVAPDDDGNSPITGYTVTAMPGGMTYTTTGDMWIQITGLTSGTAYTFTVIATNAIGSGPASAPSAPVTPTTAPGS